MVGLTVSNVDFSHPLLDRFLPTSLLHSRENLYHFSRSGSPSGSKSTALPAVVGNVQSGPHALADFHDQATLDASCQRMGVNSSVTSSDDDVNNHDHRPAYEIDCILHLLKACFSNSRYEFWAEIADGHQLEINMTNAEDLHIAFIRHLYDGSCALHKGSECSIFVTSGHWKHQMAVYLVDSTLEWVENTSIGVDDFVYICNALGIKTNTKWKVRSLRTKLVDRRREFLEIGKAAVIPLSEFFAHLGSSSSLSDLRSIGGAHGIDISVQDTREDVSTKVIVHVSRGKCVDNVNTAPGCEHLTKDQTVQRENALYLQVAVLQHILEVASRKQLCKVLDLHEIDYEPTDKPKRLKGRLRNYLQNIERGRLKDAEAKYDMIVRLRTLNDIRKCWPKLVPMKMKERIISDFRAATSSTALSTFTCACCARGLPVCERIRKLHTEVNLDLLEGLLFNWKDEVFRPPPTPFEIGPLRNKIIDKSGVIEEAGEITLELCASCSRGLRRGSLPKHALANRLYFGPVPDVLKDLTMLEECMIAHARAKSWIIKLQEVETDFSSPTAQRALKGHTIIYPQQPDRLAEVLPPPVEETLAYICVIFVGSSKMTPQWLRKKAKPLAVCRNKVRQALLWLKSHNPLYKEVEISDDNLNSLPTDDVLPYITWNMFQMMRRKEHSPHGMIVHAAKSLIRLQHTLKMLLLQMLMHIHLQRSLGPPPYVMQKQRANHLFK